MHKYGESKTTRIMMAAVRHVTSSSGLGKFQAAWICWTEGTLCLCEVQAEILDEYKEDFYK
jgi:acyl-ACP thioesterase